MSKIIGINKHVFFFIYRILNWHISHYLFKRDFPLIATFQLTNRCNFKCRMCNIRNNPKQDTISLETFKMIIDELAQMGCVYATLSGGEPLLIPDILTYAAYAKSRICYVNLVTNGYLLDDKFAREIRRIKLDTISISLDALRENNDAIRGMPGAFDRALTAIESLKRNAPQVKITVNTVISKRNLDDIVELANLTQGLGVLHKFQPVYKHPDFQKEPIRYDDLWIGKNDIGKLRSVIEYLISRKHIANSRYFLRGIADYFLSDYRKAIFNQDCIYPSFCCEFREDGNVYPCIVGKSWRDGYDIKRGLRSIFYSREYIRDIETLKKCQRCRENFSICYVESRLSLPLSNLIRYSLIKNE